MPLDIYEIIPSFLAHNGILKYLTDKGFAIRAKNWCTLTSSLVRQTSHLQSTHWFRSKKTTESENLQQTYSDYLKSDSWLHIDHKCKMLYFLLFDILGYGLGHLRLYDLRNHPCASHYIVVGIAYLPICGTNSISLNWLLVLLMKEPLRKGCGIPHYIWNISPEKIICNQPSFNASNMQEMMEREKKCADGEAVLWPNLSLIVGFPCFVRIILVSNWLLFPCITINLEFF